MPPERTCSYCGAPLLATETHTRADCARFLREKDQRHKREIAQYDKALPCPTEQVFEKEKER